MIFQWYVIYIFMSLCTRFWVTDFFRFLMSRVVRGSELDVFGAFQSLFLEILLFFFIFEKSVKNAKTNEKLVFDKILSLEYSS